MPARRARPAAVIGSMARRMVRDATATFVAILLALGAGCGGPEAEDLATRELGPLVWTEAVAGRDGGYSALWGDTSVWMFGDSIMRWAGEDGSAWRNNTFCTTTDLDASDGILPFVEPLDSLGVPREFLPMTAEEIAYEAEHNAPGCGEGCEGIAMWPGPPVWDTARGRLLVFYMKLLQRPGFLNITVLGHSVAVWADGAEAPERPEVRPGEDEPTLLFPGDDVPLAAGALLEGDWLYLFLADGDLHTCSLVRVDPALVLDAAAYRAWDGSAGAWVADLSRRTPLFDGATMLSVHWNDHLSRYLAVYSTPWGNGIDMRTAPALTGTWSAAATVHDGIFPVEDVWSYGAMAHPEFTREGGRMEVLTYYLDWDGSMRLVELEFR